MCLLNTARRLGGVGPSPWGRVASLSAHQPTGPIQAGGRVKRAPSRPSEIALPGVGEGQTVGILEGGSGPFLVAPTVSSRRINETEGDYTLSSTPILACTICEQYVRGRRPIWCQRAHRHPGTSARVPAASARETEEPRRQSFWSHPGPGEGWLHGEGQRPSPSPWSRYRPIQGGGYPLPWADSGPSNREGSHSPSTPQSSCL